MLHNFYQSSSPSGEDVVFKNEVELLKKNDIEVITYERHNDDIKDYGLWDKLYLPFRNIWSLRTYRELKQLLKKERPEIVHFHNIFYLISPSAYYACKEADVPVVQTLHNFRIFCSNGLLMRNGQVCEECKNEKTGYRSWVIGNKFKLIKNAIKYGCYRNSRIYSLAIALLEYMHWIKNTWVDKVDAYITLTEFGKRKFIEAGLPAERIFVKPNFLLNPPEPVYSHRNYAVFIGRLSAEKGLDVLINAFQHLSNISNELKATNYQRAPLAYDAFKIKIVGDGPLKSGLEQIVKDNNIEGIEFTGKKTFNECMELLKGARFLIMPSICYEGFPMAVRETFACGKPVIASRIGAMAELVEDRKTGLLFEPGNPFDLAKKMKWMIEHKAECIEMGRNARKVFEEKYTAERNFEILTGIYEAVLQSIYENRFH